MTHKNQTNPNVQDIVKMIAIFAAIIDHIGLYFLPDIEILRIIGRFAMPAFCFFAGYNYNGKIKLKILLYGLTLVFIDMFYITPTSFYINILVPIFCGLVFIKVFENELQNFWFAYIAIVIFGCLTVITEQLVDYGTMVISGMIIGFCVKRDESLKIPLIFILFFLSFLHTYCYFVTPGYLESIPVIFASIVGFFFFVVRNFDEKISFNTFLISRWSLEIYFYHLLLIQLIWKWKYFL